MSGEQSPEPESREERFIRLSIEQAKLEGRDIDDAAARLIASQLHGGQASAMYSLASAGAIDEPRLISELVLDYTNPATSPEARVWLDQLGRYAMKWGNRGTVPGWHELTTDEAIDARLALYDHPSFGYWEEQLGNDE